MRRTFFGVALLLLASTAAFAGSVPCSKNGRCYYTTTAKQCKRDGGSPTTQSRCDRMNYSRKEICCVENNRARFKRAKDCRGRTVHPDNCRRR